MTKPYDKDAKALFLSPDGNIYADYLICSGIIPAELHKKACPFALNGRVLDPHPLEADADDYTIDKGKPGDFCPPLPCSSAQLTKITLICYTGSL